MTGEPRAFASGRLRLDFPAEEVARLTIDHPAKRNALDREILDALAAEVPQLQARCLLLTAAGPVFSAGYDMRILPGGGPAEEAAIEALAGHPFPTVAALNGHAIGGGLELALACDLRIAAEPAELGMPPARLGLIYSHAGLRRFLDVIGVARSSELFFTARNIPARRALEWGLVNEVVAAHELEAFAVAYAAAIAAPAPGSL